MKKRPIALRGLSFSNGMGFIASPQKWVSSYRKFMSDGWSLDPCSIYNEYVGFIAYQGDDDESEESYQVYCLKKSASVFISKHSDYENLFDYADRKNYRNRQTLLRFNNLRHSLFQAERSLKSMQTEIDYAIESIRKWNAVAELKKK